jgi:hypothetical protein
VLFINQLLGMPLHPGQIKYLEETHALGTKINVLVPSNRWGKTSLAACLQIWYHFYKFGVPTGSRKAWVRAAYRTANVAPRSSLVEPLFNYIDQIMTSRFPINLPDGRLVMNRCQIEWFYLKDQTRESPVHKQFFAFNSYIEHRTLGATAADSLEGKPFGLITYDEGGRSLHLQDEVSGTILARLFDWGGPLHLISTPDQSSPSILYHYELYQRGLLNDPKRTKTYTMEGRLKDNIFFSPEQIQEQYDLYENDPLGPQVLEGKFVFGGDSLYNYEDILAAQDESLDDGVRRIDGHKYVLSIDTAMASDEMVYTVLDVTEKPFYIAKQLAAKGNSKSYQLHMNDFLDLFDSYNSPTTQVRIMLETWNGESARFYMDLPYELQLLTKCYGSWQPTKMNTGNKNLERPRTQTIKKADILVALKKLLSGHELRIPKANSGLIQQLSIYKEKDDNIPTDRVISLALGAWMALEPSTFPAPVQFISFD